MQWKKVLVDLCLQGAQNVCSQTSWWNPKDLASWYLRKFLSLINSCQEGKLMQKNLSLQISSQLQWKRTRIPLPNLTKKLIALIPLFGIFRDHFFVMLQKVLKILMILSHGQATVAKGDLVLMVNFWLKIFTRKV